MAVAANCTQCADDPSSSSGQHQQLPSVPTILGVLGAVAAVAFAVVVAVPLVRRRVARRARAAASWSAKAREERDRRSVAASSAGHKGDPSPHDHSYGFFAFADDNDEDGESDDEDNGDAIYGDAHTDRATYHHPHVPSDSTGTGQCCQCYHYQCQCTRVPPRFTTYNPHLPRGCGVHEQPNAPPPVRRAPSHLCPLRPPIRPRSSRPPRPAAPTRAPHPHISPTLERAANVRPARSVRAVLLAAEPGVSSSAASMANFRMAPLYEDGDGGDLAETRSLQLPSPPASPDRGYGPQARRPSLTGRPTSTSTSSGRPRAGTGPSTPLPLTAAFNTSVLKAGGGEGARLGRSASVSGSNRFPAIAPRSRPSSATVRPHAHAGEDAEGEKEMARPTEAFRRMSTTDIRQRHPYARELELTQPAAGTSASAGRRHRDAAVYSPPAPRSPSPLAGHGQRPHPHPHPHPPSAFPYGSGARQPSGLASPTPTPTTTPTLNAITNPIQAPAPRLSVQTATATRHAGVSWKSLASGSKLSMGSQGTFGGGSSSGSRSRSGSMQSVNTGNLRLPPVDAGSSLSLGLDEEDRRRKRGA
ncbi:uncharacterized protein BXZ73DRAFT_97650 [Epithele typhae]|uniref:uncharacterized protein n=1 Tax=Epithele typhae TaxID=378194 RepID=UPI0020080C93|nr:uncharacterized protein BXZ73DRAFT_97650 [Epithele typhae]KAH9942231.1 hypothetical protein BXZ73DRAFT_97650 [Epithele typhae]